MIVASPKILHSFAHVYALYDGCLHQSPFVHEKAQLMLRLQINQDLQVVLFSCYSIISSILDFSRFKLYCLSTKGRS
jgi:hypothetical protein